MATEFSIKDIGVHVGDVIRLGLRVAEGNKERVQVFEGLVISLKGRGENKMFTVRKIASGGMGVERVIPVNSPWISNVEVKSKSKVRRSKLYYVRQKSTRQLSAIANINN